MTVIRQFVQYTIKVFVERVFHWALDGERGLLVYNPKILYTIAGIIVNERKVVQRFDRNPGRLAAGVCIRSVD